MISGRSETRRGGTEKGAMTEDDKISRLLSTLSSAGLGIDVFPSLLTLLSQFTLTDGSVEDASWEMKSANMLRVQTGQGKTVHFVCENRSTPPCSIDCTPCSQRAG